MPSGREGSNAAEYTCPRCGSNVSTHICMKAEPVAGETKRIQHAESSLRKKAHERSTQLERDFADYDVPAVVPVQRPASVIAGETKFCSCCGVFNPEYTHPCGESYCWHCEDNRGRHDDCEKCAAPAVAAPAEGNGMLLIDALMKALDGLLMLKEETEMDYESAYHAMFKNVGAARWKNADKALEAARIAKQLRASTPPTADPQWRVGKQVRLNVYEGDRPVCQCHTEEDARRIVEAVNGRS